MRARLVVFLLFCLLALAAQRRFGPVARDPLPAPAPARDLWDAGADYLPLPAAERISRPDQSLAAFRAGRPEPLPADGVFYLQPLDWPGAEACPVLQALVEWGSLWTGRELRLLPNLEVKAAGFTTRARPDLGLDQVLVGDVLARLAAQRPKDALGLVALTTWDLYPGPRWNYVFAQASPRDRVSVLSLARYHPDGPLAWTARRTVLGETRQSWFAGATPFPKDGADRGPLQVAALRAIKLLGSQMGALLGMDKCSTWRCTMNWPDSLAALDRRPIPCCPLCLRKIDHALAPDHLARYRRLAACLKRLGLDDEAAWYERRLRALSPAM